MSTNLILPDLIFEDIKNVVQAVVLIELLRPDEKSIIRILGIKNQELWEA